MAYECSRLGGAKRFDVDLKPRQSVKLIQAVQYITGKGDCIYSCGSSVAHPVHLDNMLDLYTRSSTVDGVVVPVKIRAIEVITHWCVSCVNVFLDLACIQQGIPIAPVPLARLSITRDQIYARIAVLEKQVEELKDQCGAQYFPVRNSRVSRGSHVYQRERASTVRYRRSWMSSPESLELSALRARLKVLESLNVDGEPTDDVMRICNSARVLVEVSKYAPLDVLNWEVNRPGLPVKLVSTAFEGCSKKK